MAQRLGKEFSIPVIKPNDSVYWILNDPSHACSTLAQSIRDQLNRGEPVEDHLVVESIQTLTLNGIYATRG